MEGTAAAAPARRAVGARTMVEAFRLRGEWLPGGDELTPTMKLKRPAHPRQVRGRDRGAVLLGRAALDDEARRLGAGRHDVEARGPRERAELVEAALLAAGQHHLDHQPARRAVRGDAAEDDDAARGRGRLRAAAQD